MSVVRTSKVRHVYGKVVKRDNCYDNIRVSRASLDSMACDVNLKFLAIIVDASGGGAFMVLPLTKYGRVLPDYPVVNGHRSYVTDIAFSLHDDNVIASASDDCTVKIWRIPDEGLTEIMTEPLVDLAYHQRRVNLIVWHPTAQNVLLSAAADNRIAIWNVGTGETMIQMDCHPDVVFSASWNWNGSKLVTTCKDKKVRIINPRSGEIEEEAVCHEGTKPTRAVYLKNGKIFTTGFARMSEWQYSLRTPGKLATPLCMESNDSTNGIMFPMYDADTNMMYLCGKGDTLIRYYEITDEPPYVHPINILATPEPQRGISMMPKRGCDIRSCEVARFYRLTSSGFCQVLSMNCPRKSELFQDDLFPDTLSEEPALEADEWMSGLNADPVLMSLRFTDLPSKHPKVNIKPVAHKTETEAANKVPKLKVTPSAPGASSGHYSSNYEETSSDDDERWRHRGTISTRSTLEIGRAVRKQRSRGGSLNEDPSPGSDFLPRIRTASSYSRVSDISDLNEEVASHEERLRALERLLANRGHIQDGDLPRVVSALPRDQDVSAKVKLFEDENTDVADGHSEKNYAELITAPKCAACDEVIIDEEYTWAQGKSFHVKHFTCFKCDKALAGNEYYHIVERDLPICLMCHH